MMRAACEGGWWPLQQLLLLLSGLATPAARCLTSLCRLAGMNLLTSSTVLAVWWGAACCSRLLAAIARGNARQVNALNRSLLLVWGADGHLTLLPATPQCQLAGLRGMIVMALRAYVLAGCNWLNGPDR
jgi:hypothetical protein